MNSGQYSDVSEAICVSLINHDIIQRQAEQNGGVEITRADLLNDRASFVRGSRGTGAHPAVKAGSTPEKEIPDIFLLPRISPAADEFPHIADEAKSRSIVGPKDWLFGQYNKLLPLKATLRGILNLSGSTRDGLAITEATRTISTQAWVLGDYLDELDRKSGVTRENALSTAFPTTRGSGSPGQSRFASQFVASVNAEGIATGLPIAMRLAVYVAGKTPRLNLSRQGAKFALLENPILDQGAGDQSKFSPTEVSFLVNHILTYVPEERSAFKVILGAISERVTTPKALDRFLSSDYADSTMTPAFLSLQRSGVMSRLIDLQLVRRLREGTRVTYAISESGADVLKEISTADAEFIKELS